MRVSLSLGAAAVAASATMLLAPTASADAPGDNGTIKVHDARTGEELVKNEPHVCTFYLDAFFFDGRQQAAWKIVDQPPTGHDDVVASTGAITLDGAGHGRTGDLTLPDGHYKLEWNFDGEHGKAKQKVFWVDCADEGASAGGTTAGSSGGSTGGSTSGADSAGSSDGGTSGNTTGGGTSGTPSGTPTVADTSSPTSAASAFAAPAGGSLAETGASVLGISGAAVALLVAGGVVLARRRGGRQH